MVLMTGVIGAGLYKRTKQKCLMRDLILGTKDLVHCFEWRDRPYI